MTSYAIPRAYGGGGVDEITAALIAEELSWGCAGLAATIQATMFPVRPLLFAGSDAQRDRYLPMLASEGGVLAAIAFTEPGAGSDLAAIRATARRDGGDFVLSGEKCYVTNGGVAELTVVFARLDGEITAFLVERGDRGVRAGRKEQKLGLRASYTGSVLLDEARIPADRLLGEPGQGFEIAMDFFQVSRPQVAAGAVGLARAAFEYATAYARERQAFGQPISKFQAIQAKLADMSSELEGARMLTYRAALLKDAGKPFGLAAAHAKLKTGRLAVKAADEAVQIHGGYGYIEEYPVCRFYRDAKILTIGEGTDEVQQMVIARALGA